MRFGSFTYLLRQGVRNTYINKAMSAASIGVLTICLVIVGVAFLLSENIKNIVGFVQQQNEIVVYVQDDITPEDAATLDRQIRSMENISSVEYTSKEQAFDNQKELLGDLLDGYENEDVYPASYHIKVKDLALIEDNVKTLKTLGGIYKVDAPTDVAEVMVGINNGIAIAGSVTVIALIVVSLVIIMNTIKITVFSRRREINIMKHVGATNGFVYMPFLVEGMILGAVSAVLAFFVMWYLYSQIVTALQKDPVSLISSMTQSLIPFESIGFVLFLFYLVIGMAVGGVGSMLSTRKHLKV